MINRSKLREIMFKLVFMASFYDEDDAISRIKEFEASSLEPEIEDDELDLDDSQVMLNEADIMFLSDEDREYIIAKTVEVIKKASEIDSLIEEKSVEWKISRIGRIELSLIRLAAYEALYDDEVPAKVAIDEAVELSKRYGQQQSYSFVNGVLARLV